MTTRVPIAFSEIEMAFDFVSFGGLSLNEAWICRETGRIWYVADDDIEDEPLPEDLGDEDRYTGQAGSRSGGCAGHGFCEPGDARGGGPSSGYVQPSRRVCAPQGLP